MSHEEPWAGLITETRILHLHERALSLYGGSPGGPLSGCVNGKLAAAWAAEAYVGGEAGIEGLTFASYLLFYVAKGHCFVDGNKRVGWLAMVDALAVLGLRVAATTDEVVAFMESVAAAQGSTARPETAREWVTARLAAIPQT